MGPSTRYMTVFTNIRSNNRFPIVMVPKTASKTKRRVKVPSLLTLAKRTFNINLPSLLIINASPNPTRFKVLKNTSEQHVIPLILRVNASRPIAYIQTIIAKLSRKKLAPLLPPQISIPARQMRVAADLVVFRCGGDAGMAEAGAADGEFEEGGAGGGGIGEIGEEQREGLGEFVFPTEVANEREESGGDARNACPVAWIVV